MRATPIKIVIDANDPLAQARFWAETMGYDVEDTTELIGGLLDADHVEPDVVHEVDGRRYFKDLVGISDPDATGPRILFQRNAEAKTAKNRVHLDLHVGPERRDGEVERLQAIGAQTLYEIDEPGGHHVTMADPEGNEFDVQ